MATLSAFYSGQDGKQINVAENGDKVNVVFTDPADNARDVEVSIVETDDPDKPHSEKNGDRTIMVVRGDFVKKKFLPNNYHIVSQVSADPRRAVNISIAVGEGAQWATELPQDRPEGGRFDLRLDIKNPADGKTRKGVALLHVYYKMDIMIIPKTGGTHNTVLSYVRAWSKQWKAWAPATRQVVELALDPKPVGTPLVDQDFDGFVAAITKAMNMAHGGAVGLAAGHGGALNDTTAWVNIIPEDRPLQADHHDLEYRLEIDGRLLDNAVAASGGGSARPIILGNERVKITNLNRAGAIMAKLPAIEELRLLTCNVGQFPSFCQRMADRLRVPVRGYTDYLDIGPTYYAVESDKPFETPVHKHEWPSSAWLSPLATPGAVPPPLPAAP